MVRTDVVGSTVGPYTVLEFLGQGQFGQVYLASDQKGRRIAVKALHRVGGPDRDVMRRELEIGTRSISPHVVRVLDFDLDSARPWLAMEYVEGDDLSRLIENGELTEARIQKIATELARGLAALSDRRIVHRDLKPHNIRIGVADSVKIIDMGLAKRTDSGRTIAGSPAYMAPEALHLGASSPKSDIWSFGVIVAEMLTGDAPTHGNDSIETVLRRTPSRWRGIVGSCLAMDPKDRPSAAQLVAALDPSATTLAPVDKPAGLPSPHGSPPPAAYPAQPPPPPPPAYPTRGPMRSVGQPRSASVALGLALILGVYGVHRFYLGHHRAGVIQMFTAGGFLVWLVMDISDILAGRMSDIHGQPLVGEPTLRGAKPFLRIVWRVARGALVAAAALVGFVGLFGGIVNGVGLVGQGDPDGAGMLVVGVILMMPSLALFIVWMIRRSRAQAAAGERTFQSP